MSKKNVLWLSGIGGGLFLFLLLILVYNLMSSHRDFLKEVYSLVVYVFSPLPFVFIFSLITYKMREEFFQAWWKFARWFVPVIIFATWFINFQSGGSGMTGTIGKSFDMFVLGIFYAVFVITSSVKIFLVYKRSK